MASTSLQLRLDLLLGDHPLRLGCVLNTGGDLIFAGSLKVQEGLGKFLGRLWQQLTGESDLPFDQILPDLTLESINVGLRYNRQSKSTAFLIECVLSPGATSAALDVFFVNLPKDGGTSDWIFGLNFRSEINLRTVPVVGGLVGDITLKGFQALYTSTNLPAPNLSLPAPDSDGSQPQYNINLTQPLTQGLALAFMIDSGDARQTFVFNLSSQSTKKKTNAIPQPSDEVQALLAPEDEAKKDAGITKWFEVQKTLGPLLFQRVGVEWKSGELGLMLDAGVRLSILSIGLKGFALRFPPSLFFNFSTEALQRDLHIGLDGLDLSYQSGALTIRGAFLRKDDNGNITYEGEALIAFGSFSLAAIGSYSEVEKHPSLFIFAFVGVPIGGPPCFFVTGLAGGFGYNQRINLPAFDQVQKFPLVKFVTGENPTQTKQTKDSALDALTAVDPSTNKPYLEAALGSNWLAAGIRFTSFDIVNSFALLIVEFGKELEISLLGLAHIQFPKSDMKLPPIVVADLGLQVVFLPSEGIFRATASLASNSYLLDPNCMLTGGFAFYLWFNSEHAGDFILTLGGYHPAYNPPAHYPQVPRLGFNWPLGNLALSGGMYFALTPSCLMAGGLLNAVYQSGDVRAWFTAQADFLIAWSPLHYEAFIGIRIGVVATVHFVFCSQSVSFELGVSLHIWGPPFCCTVTIQWWVISFTISIIEGNPVSSNTIDWDTFRDTFLTQPKTNGEANGGRRDLVWQVRPESGLIRQKEDGTWLVTGDRLTFTIQSAIPTSKITLGKPGSHSDSSAQQISGTNNFGIRPVGCAHPTTEMNVTLESSGSSLDLSNWDAHAINGGVPSALWGATPHDPTRPPDSENEVIQGALLGVRLRPKDNSKTYQGPSPISLTNLGCSPIGSAPLLLIVKDVPLGGSPSPAVKNQAAPAEIRNGEPDTRGAALRRDIVQAAIARRLAVHAEV
jgi:hypothetical protein